MNMEATPPQPAALEMRHGVVADLQRHFIEHLEDTMRQWWRQAWDRLAQEPDANTVALLSSQCRRRFGERPLPSLHDGAVWTQTQLARALLLTQALEHQPAADRQPLLRQLFSWGDDQEKIATLKALDWLDGSGCCVNLALKAGRTNNSQVFAAIAQDNPYPARHYDERSFHQLVLKTLGMELNARRILGLPQRRSPALNQLALELLEELLAAGRTVPEGLPHIIAFPLLDPAQADRLDALCQQRRLPPEWLNHLRHPDGTEPC